MVRSLTFVYLFVILTVSYLGGAILFRGFSDVSVVGILKFFDARVVDKEASNFLQPALNTALFFVVVYILSRVRQLKLLVLFTGALKAVLFGLSASYLLDTDMRMLEYAVWWFPFQFITSFLLLAFCVVISPPFFRRTTGRQPKDKRGLITIFMMTLIVTITEVSLFYFIFQ